MHRHRSGKLGLLLGPTSAWMLVVYLGSLAILFASAFWTVNPLTGFVERQFSLQNFQTMASDPVYRTIAIRTVLMSAAVTATDIALAFPLAYYAARLASPRMRSALVIAVVLPLWSSYLVRVFAWLTILEDDGPAQSLLRFFHINVQLIYTNWGVWLTFTYLWLPFVLLPIYASLERIPGSFLEASGDLGAKGWTTFRRITLPLLSPVLFYSLLISVVGVSQYFIQAYVLKNGNPDDSTLFYNVNLYREAFTFNQLGYASALAWVLFLIVLGLALLLFWSSSRWVFYAGERR